MTAGAAAALTTSSASAATPQCREVVLPVALNGVGVQRLAGTLCQPRGARPATVQLLLSGATYDRTYWDFAYRPATYSYVRSATAAGYATFALDRLGTGRSSRPPGMSLTLSSQAGVAHQVVRALRTGAVAGRQFRRVVLTGHSLGSAVAWFTAGTYGDVDGVIVSGQLHRAGPTALETFGRSTWPAASDPQFAGTITDPTYLTTRPGVRDPLFHSMRAEPLAVALDELTKDVVTAGEVAGLPTAGDSGMSSRIDVPVLIAVGSEDRIFCGADANDCRTPGAVLAQEAPSYGKPACVEAFVLPGAGHSINLASNAPQWFAAAARWMDRTVGTTSRTPC